MAKSYAHCATPDCTNTILFIEQNRKAADRKAEWAESQGFICSECQEKPRQKENAKAAQQNQAAGLPELTGSDKQIAWAEKIRAEKLETIRQAKAGELDRIRFEAYFGGNYQAIAIDDVNIDYAIELITAQTAASWWIDHREKKVGVVLRELFIANPPKAAIEPDQQAIIDEAKIEATVRPTEAITETVAEIQTGEQSVSVLFPEKTEQFRAILKKHGFKWTGYCWKRKLSFTTGTPFDRAAEIGHILLGSGFIIRVYDDETRALAISGDYQEEQTRWIKAYTSGSEQGRLCVTWGRDEDYYKAAKRIPTARYVKPALSVAAEQFEQLLDFAEINGFGITPSAMQLIDAAREAKYKALVAHVELADKPHQGDDGKPVKMDIPDSIEISDDLLD